MITYTSYSYENLTGEEKWLVEAAEGWLMLSNPREAFSELERICGINDEHQYVIALRAMALVQIGKIDEACILCKTLCDVAPRSVESWINHGNLMRQHKGMAEALAVFKEGLNKIPNATELLFNLACCAAQLGCIDEAMEWLTQCLRSDTSCEMKQLAFSDPDLYPIWLLPEIQRGAQKRGHVFCFCDADTGEEMTAEQIGQRNKSKL